MSLVYSSNYAAIGFVATFVAFFVCEQIGGVIIPKVKRGGAKVKRRNVGSGMLVICSWVAIFALPVIVAKLGIWVCCPIGYTM
jgi:hypothetical protein